MVKTKKIILSLCVLFLSVLTFLSFNFNQKQVRAEEIKGMDNITEELHSNSEIAPRLFATLSISLNGGNGKVWATVKNDFTLFPSTVKVILQLFYSFNYCEDYNQMTLVAMNSTDDLDMGKTIVVESSTDGAEKFWMARMRYKEDSGDWKEKIISARYSADGTYMGIA